MSGDRLIAVARSERVARDMDVLAALFREHYVGHAAMFRCADPAAVNGQVHTSTANGLTTGWLQYGGFEYTAALDPVPGLMTVTVLQGAGSLTAGGREHRFAVGDVILMPPGEPSRGQTVTDITYATLQVPWSTACSLVEEGTGLPAQDLRFEATAPLSAAHQRKYARTAAYISGQFASHEAAGMPPILVEAMTRLAAASMLETFPNTTMTVSYLPGPGWMMPSAVRRAAAYIDAHASEPLTAAQAAVAAGVTPRALQYAFQRHYDITVEAYHRRVRLEQARRDLLAADGATVAVIARKWGWGSPAQFAAAYHQRFGELPAQALRT